MASVTRDVLSVPVGSTTNCGWSTRVARRAGRGSTQLRQWATARLGEYLVKGFTIDHERLKNPPDPGQQEATKRWHGSSERRVRRSNKSEHVARVMDAGLLDTGPPFMMGLRREMVRQAVLNLLRQRPWFHRLYRLPRSPAARCAG